MNYKTNRESILIKFFAISLFFHLSFSFIYFKTEIQPITLKADEQVQKIRINLQSRKPKQIVQTQNSNNKKAKSPTYLSEKNNSYDRQTRSRFVDKYSVANKGIRNAKKRKFSKAQKKTSNKKIKNLKFSDLGVKLQEKYAIKRKKKKRDSNSARLGLKNGRKTGKALGASSDFLQDIPLGDFTKLNTQEYEYYGFYHRIREKLEQFWGNNIQSEAQKIFKKGRSIASESNLITGLVIKINSKGEIVDIALKSTSGVKELDDAAIKSFNQAGPFPNPPKGMLKADGKAIIEWGFVVNT